MAEPVTCDLVTACGNVAHQLRVAFGDPSEHEERRIRAAVVEYVEYAMGIRDDARFELRPIVRRNLVAKRGDLKVVFDVDC